MSDRHDRLEAELLELKQQVAVSQRRSRRQRVTNVFLGALVLAFGGAGAAYAVTLAPANSVNTAAIIDRTIGTPDVKVGAFAGQTILDNSMTGADINESTLVPTCQANMSRLGDFCFGDERAKAPQTAAVHDCAADKLRLPSLSEGRMLVKFVGASGLWIDAAFQNGDTYMGMVTDSDTWLAYPSSEEKGFRCVTTVGARP